MNRIAVVGWGQETNVQLADAWRERGIPAVLLSPPAAMRELGAGDIAIGRLDVLPTLDGVEPGLVALRVAAASGARVVNDAKALLGAHDKLRTAHELRSAHIPHPPTVFVPPRATRITLEPPLVLKPRFGSWGVDVLRCQTAADVQQALELVADRPWFRRRGAVVQQLIAPRGYDLRLIVAGGRVVGAVERVAAPGEWRTNISLGGSRRPASPPREAIHLGIGAAAAIGADFVGVDLLPVDGGHIVLELNGAVEFDDGYDLPGGDVYLDAARALELVPSEPLVLAGRRTPPGAAT